MKNKHAFIISVVAFVWAGSFIAVKIGVGEISPVMLAFLRFAIASPVMFFIMVARGGKRLERKDFPHILLLSLTGVTLLYLLQFMGIKYSTASDSAILINTNVIFIAILSAIFLREKFSHLKYIGVILGFSGAAVIASNGSLTFSTSFKGDLLVLLSALCWGIYSVAGKKLLEKYDAITITSYAFVFGTLLFIPFLYGEEWKSISINGWIITLYLSLLCSVFAYVAWYNALAEMEATNVAIFLNLIPLFAIILSYVILNEKITLMTLAGAALIIYGIYMTEKGSAGDRI